jgi:hypothetical protein
MGLDRLFSTIILVSFLVTILMAVGSYGAYKLRESRRPRHVALPPGEPMLLRVTAEEWEQDGAHDGAATRDRITERPRA